MHRFKEVADDDDYNRSALQVHPPCGSTTGTHLIARCICILGNRNWIGAVVFIWANCLVWVLYVRSSVQYVFFLDHEAILPVLPTTRREAKMENLLPIRIDG